MKPADDFWTRRKAAVRAEADAEQRALAAERRSPTCEVDKTDAEILADLNLPDPDDMGAGDDFTAFLKNTVPERIRRRALRKLWLSNPVLANLDELVDYGEDFTDAATVFDSMQTTYQVGRGMMKHLLEMERTDSASVPDDGDADAEADDDDGTDIDPEIAEAVADEPDAEADGPPAADVAQPMPQLEIREDVRTRTIPRPRMRFEFTS